MKEKNKKSIFRKFQKVNLQLFAGEDTGSARVLEIGKRLLEIGKEIETLGDELTAEQLKKLEDEVDALKNERTKLLDVEKRRRGILETIANGTVPAKTTRTFPTPSGTAEGNKAEPEDIYSTPEYRRAFKDYVTRKKDIPAEFRADETTKTTDVGAVIPTVVLNKIIDKLQAVGMILPLVTNTAYRGGMAIPKSSVKPVATWVAEGSGSDKQKKAVGSVTFAYHKLRCAVAVSMEVDTMSIPAFEAVLVENVVEAMTKALEQAIISGTGTGQPKGILTETPLTGQSITSATPDYDDLIEAEAKLPLEYESDAVWCMSKQTFMKYYGLKDDAGQPIGRINYGIAGKPERSLLGRPVVSCNYVQSFTTTLAAGAVYAFLFNFKDYILNTNYAMGIKRYEDNENDDQVTRAVMLADGKAVDVGSLVTIKK